MQDAVKSAPTLEGLREKRDEILRLAEKRGAYNLRVFGSVARGEARPESDIDIMANSRQGASIFDVAGLWGDLEELLELERSRFSIVCEAVTKLPILRAGVEAMISDAEADNSPDET